ncbi:hypothetical protein [Petrocella sp. FN5]|uniref:hypothetical protein n=1 Tax=Petrocella sp. FN5 TaxID=3032002 RepID=UPI0023DAFCB5|nr:hypothetical protein [Petrocella sp. FN5]MDF1618704.1 hypothetical protein [Petrocella sp. FN5]
MKKILAMLLLVVLVLTSVGCSSTDYSGEYVGYSWKGESKGVTFEEATEKIETKMTLDKKGIITDFEMDFLVSKDDQWIKRNDPAATVSFDTSIEPTPAIIGSDSVESGESMFDIKTNDKMSLFVVGVDDDGTVAYGIVDPITRYLFEAKFEADYDYSTKLGQLTIDNGLVPTVRTSGSGLIKLKAFEELEGLSLLDFSIYSHVINLRGVYKDITNDTTIEELLTLSGVTFENGKPQPLEGTHGFHSIGGWNGNYKNIAKTMIGKNATELTGLTDFEGKNYEGDEYKLGIDENNFFGIYEDSVTGATKTIQKSYETVAGATIRISRENTSFQRALVEAGIITEEDVIKGRF